MRVAERATPVAAVIKRACAGRGAKVDLAARIFPMPSDAGGKIEQLGYRLQVWRGILPPGMLWAMADRAATPGWSHLARRNRSSVG
jgi:hypothetical protein